MRRKEVRTVLFSLLLTVSIIFGLIFIGPAKAFSFALDVDNATPSQGDIVTFNVNVSIDAGERLNISKFTFELIGPTNISCMFFPNGTAKSGCANLTIIPVSSANVTIGNLTGNFTIFNSTNAHFDFGFGYGFGDNLLQLLSFDISINTSILNMGVHTSRLVTTIDTISISHQGANVTLVPTIITNVQNLVPSDVCVLPDENVTFFANITGEVVNVTFAAKINNSWTNFSLPFTGVGVYSHTVDSSVLMGGKKILYHFIAHNSQGIAVSGAIKQHVTKRSTDISLTPTIPNGLNNWYLVEPNFTLQNNDAGTLFYQWDSTGIFNHSGSLVTFDMEHAPNNGSVTGGIHELNYWSSVCNETKKNITVKTDFTNPVVTNIIPANNSVVLDLSPTISALLDEVFQSNSGIDKSSVTMMIDGVLVTPLVVDADSIDAIVSHTPNLIAGSHSAKVNVTDFAGRNSQLTWFFSSFPATPFDLNIHNPNISESNRSRIKFNISTSELMKSIEYKNLNDRRPRFRRLCRNCDEYGMRRNKIKTVRNGVNILVFKATNLFGEVVEKNVTIFVDSDKPRITRTFPRRNRVVNGSFFEVQYTENNVNTVHLLFNPNISIPMCPSGRRMKCSTGFNLSDFDNSLISFIFRVSDNVSSVDSRLTRVFVDTTVPTMEVHSPVNGSTGRRVQFNISVSELSTIEFMDLSKSRPRWRRLCSRCDEYGMERARFKRFKGGIIPVVIRARDEAGNAAQEKFELIVS